METQGKKHCSLLRSDKQLVAKYPRFVFASPLIRREPDFPVPPSVLLSYLPGKNGPEER